MCYLIAIVNWSWKLYQILWIWNIYKNGFSCLGLSWDRENIFILLVISACNRSLNQYSHPVFILWSSSILSASSLGQTGWLPYSIRTNYQPSVKGQVTRNGSWVQITKSLFRATYTQESGLLTVKPKWCYVRIKRIHRGLDLGPLWRRINSKLMTHLTPCPQAQPAHLLHLAWDLVRLPS